MHKFATDSYESLCGDRSDAHAWRYSIPQKAYSHDYLLHGMLAFAALHIAATSSDSNKALKYLDTAVEYSSLSFGSFQKAISQLTPQTCESIFACSAIVMVISIALPFLSAKHRDEKLLMLGTMTTAWELHQGGRRISHISEPWLHDSIFSNYDFWKMQTGDLDPETNAALSQLDELNYLIAESHTEIWDSNHETIELLRLCFSKFAHSPHPAAILGWLAYVQKAFVDQLRSRKPLQLLIFMHWGVLLNELGYQFWWARGSGKALVAEISGELGSLSEDTRWAPAMEWPQRQTFS
ncbi:hypothetical protein N7481_004302 [Penicillium waksmanii]|uniref:uncharacterized protein n=1 Tax=Penicillium waksmanii TaxID=69791 RepID=UPI0025479DC0|nr:uncharacterized protein N7481_004302 [Penicillium waksmanii]KAJ5989092.1 hypothetical protein N7481_004302 [Penicillium waksmanii]